MHWNLFDTVAVLTVIAAVFAYVNHRFVRLPFTIGLLVSGLAASMGVLLLDAIVPSLGIDDAVRGAIASIDFHESLMHGMLSFLLFAGALHVDLDALLRRKAPILTLASVGVAISTAIVGFGSYALFQLVGASVPLPYCLVFGALIAPTDPIAVLGIMKSAKAPESLEIKVAGESLFNDGVGVIVFAALLAAAGGSSHGAHDEVTAGFLTQMFAVEVFGGIALGLAGGALCYFAMKTLDDANLEVLLSMALVMGVTFVAFRLHASAPLACVVAGLFIGNHGRESAMSDPVRNTLDLVWSFIDEALNAILFLLVGLEVLAIPFSGAAIFAALLAIPLALVARFASGSVPITGLRLLRHEFSPGVVRILTWGGLKGGISVALALSLPAFEGREVILTATYAIVVFSIVVQGLTIGRLIRSTVASEGATS